MAGNFNFTSDEALRDAFVNAPAHKEGVDPDLVQPALQRLAPLVYDFDIVEIAPDAAQRKHLDALAALGQTPDSVYQQVRWRDPRTAKAMRMAGSGVQQIFQKAGFGDQPSGSAMAPGTFDAIEGPDRHDAVMRLTNLIAESNADTLDWGQFDMAAFFKANATAEPVRLTQNADALAPPQSDGKRKLAFVVFAAGVVLLGLAGAMML